LLAPAAAPPSIGIRLLEVPARQASDPRARAYIVDHLEPGATVRRKIEVSNATGASQTVELYAGAASVAGGSFVVSPGGGGNDLATWTSVDPDRVTLPTGQAVQATVTIAVPSGARAGERYGVVWAQLAAPSNPGFHLVNRVGIRIYLSVSGGEEPASDFTIDTLTTERLSDGRPAVSALVHNTGGRALDMSGSLELHHGPGGLSAGPFPARLGTTLAPGQEEPVTVVLDPRIPPGPWDAVINLRSGLIERSARATIIFPRTPGTSSPPVTAHRVEKRRRLLLPLAAILLGLVAAGLAFFLRERRRRR